MESYCPPLDDALLELRVDDMIARNDAKAHRLLNTILRQTLGPPEAEIAQRLAFFQDEYQCAQRRLEYTSQQIAALTAH